MTKEEEITLLYQLIEKHFGSGVLMEFEDLIEDDKGAIKMTTYNSYEAAKIANPESEIWASKLARCGRDNVFGTKVSLAEITNNYIKCNPASHCMTVEKFLADGHKFVEGDLIYNYPFNRVDSVDTEFDVRTFAHKDAEDNKRYILRAAALETKEPKRTKVEYVKVDCNTSIFTMADSYRKQELFDSNKEKVKSEIHLVELLTSNLLYRRIEISIEWWEGASEFINQTDDDNCSSIMEGKLHVNATLTQDQWCDFARILLEQGE